MNVRVGQRLGNYRLISLLGQGGFAHVYLGQHIHLDTLAAIKVLDVQLTKDKVTRFREEARTIANLVHPHIVRVLDFAIDRSTPFLVMDFVPNKSLYERHFDERLPLSTVVCYVKQIAAALDYVHSKGIIHRDIKPTNMLLDANNNIVLSDFGIALMADGIGFPRTRVEGTISYISPEQIRGRSCLTSDLYSLGIVVYEWLTGYLPFYGTHTEIAKKHLYTPPPLLREMASGVSPAVEQVVMKALEKDPNRRFASAGAFSTAMEQASKPIPVVEVSSPPSFRYHPTRRSPHVAVYRRHGQVARQGLAARQQQRVVALQKDLENPPLRAPHPQW